MVFPSKLHTQKWLKLQAIYTKTLRENFLYISYCTLVYSRVYDRVTIFSLRKTRAGSLRVIMSEDVHFSPQKQVKTKKKGHHVRRYPFFLPKPSEDKKNINKKKVITSAGQ